MRFRPSGGAINDRDSADFTLIGIVIGESTN